jgi:hypothetical protein
MGYGVADTPAEWLAAQTTDAMLIAYFRDKETRR